MRTRVWLAAAALGLSLCGGAGAATTLKLVEVITSPERTETLRAIVKTFENANPGTEVEIISLPWGPSFEKLATMVAAGDTPDVVEMPDMWLALYANNGWLESLEPYLKTWPHTRELNQRTLQLGRVIRNTAYMLPYGFYLRALYYNKKMFAAAGIAAPPRTVDEFVAVARRISATPGRYGYCLRGGPGGVNGWMMFGALRPATTFISTPTAPRPSPIRAGSTASPPLPASIGTGWRRPTASTGVITISSRVSTPASAP